MTGFLFYRVYRLGIVNFGVYTDAPNVRHLGSKPQGTLHSSCHRNRSYFLPNKWDRLSDFSVLALIGVRHCIHRDGTTINQMYALRAFPCVRSLQMISLNLPTIGEHAPDGKGCHISEAGTIISLAYISLLICETSEFPGCCEQG